MLLTITNILLGTLFVIRIANFKKDAWIIYLLATLIGVVNLAAFNSQFTLNNLGINFILCLHDIILASIGIYFFYFQKITIKRVNNLKEARNCWLLIFVISIVLILWTFLYQKLLFNSYPILYNLISFILISLTAFILLIRGYILGFIISAFSETITLIFYFYYSFNFIYITPVFFHFINLIIYLYAYNKYSKKTKNIEQ